MSTRLGLLGMPSIAESVVVARDGQIAEYVGEPVHFSRISCARSLDLIRGYKRREAPLTCDVTPHHIWFNDHNLRGFSSNMRLDPPIRSLEDQRAIRRALKDGTIDAVCTDHRPQSSIEKDVEFDHAEFGVIGLETAVSIGLSLVAEGVIEPARLVDLYSWNPARILGMEQEHGHLGAGACADVTIVDPSRKWTVRKEELHSLSKNTLFDGAELTGRVTTTVVAGKVVYNERT